jgi:hypothetical protein
MNENLCGKGTTVGADVTPLLSPLFPLLGAGLLFCCVEVAATVGLWPPRASHRASAALTMAAAVLWTQLLQSLSLIAEHGSKTLREKDRCRVTLLEGDVV